MAINDENSVYYWAAKNDIPVFSPALTDGAIGELLFFHANQNPQGGLILDTAQGKLKLVLHLLAGFCCLAFQVTKILFLLLINKSYFCCIVFLSQGFLLQMCAELEDLPWNLPTLAWLLLEGEWQSIISASPILW